MLLPVFWIDIEHFTFRGVHLNLKLHLKAIFGLQNTNIIENNLIDIIHLLLLLAKYHRQSYILKV